MTSGVWTGAGCLCIWDALSTHWATWCHRFFWSISLFITMFFGLFRPLTDRTGTRQEMGRQRGETTCSKGPPGELNWGHCGTCSTHKLKLNREHRKGNTSSSLGMNHHIWKTTTTKKNGLCEDYFDLQNVIFHIYFLAPDAARAHSPWTHLLYLWDWSWFNFFLSR